MSYKNLGGGDPFKTKIYKEFEENLYRVLHISLADFIRIFEGDREPPIESFSEIYDNQGPEAMRAEMNWSISCLSIIYNERELGRQMTDAEKNDHRSKLGLSYGKK